MSAVTSVTSFFAALLGQLADLVQPAFHGSATAAAVVLLTLAVRAAVHPLSRAAARGHRARTRLAPRIAELRKKHHGNPERLQRAVLDLHAKEKVSPLSGILPSLMQAPAFLLLYHLFAGGSVSGSLAGAPLGGRWTDALGAGAGLVYVVLFVIVGAVATFTYVRTRRQLVEAPRSGPSGPSGHAELPGMGVLVKAMPLLSFATLITVAVVPLAAALYVVTSTTWSAVERVLLYPATATPTGG
ncbi:YidC/Oxa1 family membrane protein insertase [Streptomyces sp. FIT100]|uniref:YidC/Oxa1 family membrane protein insertase n=1 Tax=Streptomyces sp. FIT100 TaxID=2837956 RepID=UPI0021C85961|nr:YidC/Oxa1 family membrane protein insertase [Streptomyces sp. FIT100]UUN27092.1 membrane protein insertase YidC [Streptomyces sp. FIT100]